MQASRSSSPIQSKADCASDPSAPSLIRSSSSSLQDLPLKHVASSPFRAHLFKSCLWPLIYSSNVSSKSSTALRISAHMPLWSEILVRPHRCTISNVSVKCASRACPCSRSIMTSLVSSSLVGVNLLICSTFHRLDFSSCVQVAAISVGNRAWATTS